MDSVRRHHSLYARIVFGKFIDLIDRNPPISRIIVPAEAHEGDDEADADADKDGADGNQDYLSGRRGRRKPRKSGDGKAGREDANSDEVVQYRCRSFKDPSNVWPATHFDPLHDH
ncbi:hypothetical protein GCM10009573_00320 [Agromyces bracchium]